MSDRTRRVGVNSPCACCQPGCTVCWPFTAKLRLRIEAALVAHEKKLSKLASPKKSRVNAKDR